MGSVVSGFQLGVFFFKLLKLPATGGCAGALGILCGAGGHHVAQTFKIGAESAPAFPLADLAFEDHGFRELSSDAYDGV